MSLNEFNPILWADTLLPALRANLVFGNLFNDNYEGTISRMGDTVRINAIGDITISSYSKDTDLAAPQSLTDAQTSLVISQAKYYNFIIDDVDMAQNHPTVMAEAMSWAAYDLALGIDNYLAGFYVDALGQITATPVYPVYTAVGAGLGTSTSTAFDQLIQVSQKLSEQKVPKIGRWCVIPPWITTLLLMDPRFTSYNTPEANAQITNAALDAAQGLSNDAYRGRILGMDIYESINAPHISGTVGTAGSVDIVLASHTMAFTKALGLNKTEAYRPPLRFGDAVKGLTLYGAKTVRPQAAVACTFTHPT